MIAAIKQPEPIKKNLFRSRTFILKQPIRKHASDATPSGNHVLFILCAFNVCSILNNYLGVTRACFQIDLSQSKTAATRIKFKKVTASFS